MLIHVGLVLMNDDVPADQSTTMSQIAYRSEAALIVSLHADDMMMIMTTMTSVHAEHMTERMTAANQQEGASTHLILSVDTVQIKAIDDEILTTDVMTTSEIHTIDADETVVIATTSRTATMIGGEIPDDETLMVTVIRETVTPADEIEIEIAIARLETMTITEVAAAVGRATTGKRTPDSYSSPTACHT